MTVVDAHHHLWDPARRDYPWMRGPRMASLRRRYDLGDLLREADAAGVERTILVQTVSDVAETEEFLNVAGTSGGRIAGVVGWVDLTAPDVGDALDHLREQAHGQLLVGIRHQVEDEPAPEWLLRPDVARGLESVAGRGLVYDLLVRPNGLDVADQVAGRHPGATLVLDHGGKPPIAAGDWQPWGERVARLAGHANVAVKLSGLVTEADWNGWSVSDLRPYAHHLLDSFGAERVMFGSDWPVCELAASYGAVRSAADELLASATASERAAVLGDTARRVYGFIG